MTTKTSTPAPATVAAADATSPSTTPGGPKTYYLLRADHAPKLGQRSTGRIAFQVLTDAERQSVFLRIAGNEGGGYVSDEAVPFAKIVRCINEHDPKLPVKAELFRRVFVGRSNNNWGFLTAILVYEGLLRRDPDKPSRMSDAGGWSAWASRHLEIQGELQAVKVGKEPVIRKVKAPTAEPVAEAENGAAAVEAESDQAGEVAAEGPATPDEGAPSQDATEPASTSADDVDDPAEAPADVAEPAAPVVRRKGRLSAKKA
ncbi:MAG TPA: hypothetical protein PLU79_07510 [Burkholderiaceae bacterium]|nr:hypothetical protein [Burkholderiaceae bacterium]